MVGVEGVLECVDWLYVVDGVGFFAADLAGGVVGEHLFAEAFVVGLVACLVVAWCFGWHRVGNPPLRCTP